MGYFVTDDSAAAQAAMAVPRGERAVGTEMAPFFADTDRADAAMTPIPEVFHLD